MSQGERMDLGRARALATRFSKYMEMACERVELAGSIRRKKPTVGDIELVVVPTVEVVEVRKDLFTWEDVEHCKLTELVKDLERKGIFVPRLNKNGANIAWGLDGSARYLAGMYKDFAVDVFVVRSDRMDWHGWTKVLRTGPGEANIALVTPRRKGGLLPGDLLVHDGMVRNGIGWVPLPSEEDVFRLWGMDFVEPWERSVENYRKAVWVRS